MASGNSNNNHSSSMVVDLYKMFNVPRDAPSSEIRKAYLKQARQIHPDKVKDEDKKEAATQAFAALQNAYETLMDESMRKEYDAKLLAAEAESKQKQASSNSNDKTAEASTKNGSPGNDNSHSSKSTADKHGQYSESPKTNNPTTPKEHHGAESFKSKASSSRASASGTASKPGEHAQKVPHKAGRVPSPFHTPTNSGTHAQRTRTTSSSSSSSVQARRSTAHTRRVYGINKTNGLPCKRCLNLGRFCYQHEDQDPSSQRRAASVAQLPTRARVGITQKGLPCKRCLQKGGLCFQHC